MAEYDRQTLGARADSALAVDEGLRSYMLRVYNYMGIGLVVTGLAAWFAAAAAITTVGSTNGTVTRAWTTRRPRNS